MLSKVFSAALIGAALNAVAAYSPEALADQITALPGAEGNGALFLLLVLGVLRLSVLLYIL
jgi:hypothetical protein